MAYLGRGPECIERSRLGPLIIFHSVAALPPEDQVSPKISDGGAFGPSRVSGILACPPLRLREN